MIRFKSAYRIFKNLRYLFNKKDIFWKELYVLDCGFCKAEKSNLPTLWSREGAQTENLVLSYFQIYAFRRESKFIIGRKRLWIGFKLYKVIILPDGVLTLFRGLMSDQIQGVCAILHTQSIFWTTNDKELKFYMIIDIHNLFWKIKKLFDCKC